MSVTQLYPESGDSSPEVLLISALLESGRYNPGDYFVPAEVFRAWPALHNFCHEHQQLDGSAPPVELIKERYPSFPYVPGLAGSVKTIAKQAIREEEGRRMRKNLGHAAAAVAEGNHEDAVQIMEQAIKSIYVPIKETMGLLDFDVVFAESNQLRVPIPAGRLATVTGGHDPGESWLIAAKSGIGKTWKLAEHAVAALEGGWDVLFFSMESSPKKLLRRIWAIIMRERALPFSHMSDDEIREEITAWNNEGNKGTLEIIGADQGDINARTVAAHLGDRDNVLVCLDYMGLMVTNDGQSVREDWGKFSMASREITKVAREKHAPILTAVQLNKEGDVGGSLALRQDCDLLLIVSELSETCTSVRKNYVAKNRNGEDRAVYYTKFDTPNGRFYEIEAEEAALIQMEEDSVTF